MTFCCNRKRAIPAVVLLLLTLLIAMFPAAAGAAVVSPDGWEWQNPLPQGNTLYGVWGSAADDVYAVGADGAILHFSGTAWSAEVSNTTADLNAVWGAAADDIYAVGADGKIMHYDGTSWQGSNNFGETFNGIWGDPNDPDNIFVVGNDGRIIRSDNGDWNSFVHVTNRDLRDVWGLNYDDIVAVGEFGAIFSTPESLPSLLSTVDFLKPDH